MPSTDFYVGDLEGQIQQLNSNLANKIRSNGGSSCMAKVWDTSVTFDNGTATISGATIKQACGMSGISFVISQPKGGNSGFISRTNVTNANSDIEIRGLTNSGTTLTGSVDITMLVVGTY